MNIWQVHLSSLPRGGSCVGHLFLLFIHNYLSENSYCHTNLILLIAWNLSCYLHFDFCFFCMVDQNQMNPSSISALGLFQYTICNIERMKGETLKHWVTGGILIGGGSDLKVRTPEPYVIFFYWRQEIVYNKFSRHQIYNIALWQTWAHIYKMNFWSYT